MAAGALSDNRVFFLFSSFFVNVNLNEVDPIFKEVK
jgi:hypothetical protein